MTGELWRGPRRHALAVLAIAIGGLLGPLAVPGNGSATGFDVVVKSPDGPSVDLLRPRTSFRFTSANLHRDAFATTVGRPLELWPHRPVPGGPLRLEEIRRPAGNPVASPLTGLRAKLDVGLLDFLETRITDSKGRVVSETREPLCPNGQDNGDSKSSAVASGGHGPMPMMPPWWRLLYPCGEEQAESLVWLFGRGNPVFYNGGAPVDLPDGRYVYEAVINPDGLLPEKTLANNVYRQRFSLTTDRELWREKSYGESKSGPRRAGASSSRGDARSSGLPSVRPPRAGEIDGPPGALPDPVALPASRFAFLRQGSRERISFSSIVSNAGEAPIVLFGKRRETASETMPGWQYTKGADGQVRKKPTNGFVWDARDTHFHWHYNKLAVYELLDLEGNVLRRSDKVGFCFMPTTLLRFLPVPGPVGQGAPSWYGQGQPIDCGRRRSRRVAMSLPVGWGDEYYQGVAGQSLDVTALPAGSYRLRITVNPTGDLSESDPANNVSERLISLSGKGAGRALTVPRQGIVSPEFQPLQKPNFGSPFGRVSATAAKLGATTLTASGPRMLCGLNRR